MNPLTSYKWAKSLFIAAVFASLTSFNVTAAADDRSIAGFEDTAGAFLDISSFRLARLIVFETDSGSDKAVTFFKVGDATFGYDPSRGSHYCALPWTASARSLASSWCNRPVINAEERTRAFIRAEGCVSKRGHYGNDCLVDSVLAFERLPQVTPAADWEGIFVLVRGVQETGGGHAVCVYCTGSMGFAYDPIGRQVSDLGPIDPQASQTLAHKLDPLATGGWLEVRDLGWLRRHGHLAF